MIQTKSQIVYEKVDKYRYRLKQRFEVDIPLDVAVVDTDFITIKKNEEDKSVLYVKRGYRWDGASFPAINTINFRRGSLVHDVMYQLMRMGVLPFEFRDKVDRLLQTMCIEDGMWKLRAAWIYRGVSLFAAEYAKPGTQKSIKILRAPIFSNKKKK